MVDTGRIVLAPLSKADLPLLFGWINDRQEVLLNAPYAPVHEPRHEEWLENILKARDVVIFGIRLQETGKLIGTGQLLRIDHVHRTAELQIRIGDVAERGHGYGTEAVAKLVTFAFKDLNLNRVGLHVFATNERAIRAYERAGFLREGLLRQAAHVDGRYVDIVVMGILREEHGTA